MLSPADTQRLSANLAHLRERIAHASARAGRDPETVRLVAITKYAGAGFARALLELGQRDLGENRVPHLLELAAGLGEGAPAPRWHMVGHLQRNKARKVADLLGTLHSLDSLELARQLESRRSPELPPLDAYLQVRLSDAEGRSGIPPDELGPFLEGLAGLTRVRVVGLMGLPPAGAPEDARPHFRALRELAQEVLPVVPAPAATSGGAPSPPGLSMGMTSDLEVAIAEGATVVRVGRALLEGLSPEARAA